MLTLMAGLVVAEKGLYKNINDSRVVDSETAGQPQGCQESTALCAVVIGVIGVIGVTSVSD